jgi:hypothetical protein
MKNKIINQTSSERSLKLGLSSAKIQLTIIIISIFFNYPRIEYKNIPSTINVGVFQALTTNLTTRAQRGLHQRFLTGVPRQPVVPC